MTVIAMSGEIGSLGGDVAAGVAKALGLKVIHAEIVAPREIGRPGSAPRCEAGQAASTLERWLANQYQLSRYTPEEILYLARQGNVVIRAWGTATLLRDMPQVIKVLICAPIAARVRVMMERLDVRDPDAMRTEIERFDAADGGAARDGLAAGPRQASDYDLVLNTARLPVDACVSVLCELARHSRFQDQAAGAAVHAGHRPRDLVIALILARLLAPAGKLAATPLDPLKAASTLGELLGLDAVDEDELYAAIDWLRAACRVAERADDATRPGAGGHGDELLYAAQPIPAR